MFHSINSFFLTHGDTKRFLPVYKELRGFHRGTPSDEWKGDDNYRNCKVDVSRYEIKQDTRWLGNYGWNFRDIYFDGQYALVLLHDGEHIARTSFVVKPGAVEIRQLQGTQGKRKRLAPVKWQKLLYDKTVEQAKKLGAAEIRMQSADMNPWMLISNTPNGYRKYDETALSFGMKPHPSGNYFYDGLTA